MSGIEREAKFDVDEDFVMPDLTVVPRLSVTTLPSKTLAATYYDTPDLLLGRWGITLRIRSGEDAGDLWTLKLPQSTAGNVTTRQEIEVAAATATSADAGLPEGGPPSYLLGLVRTFTRGALPAPVAEITTVRRRHLLLAPKADTRLGEIDEDSVQFRTADGRHGTFHEVEVELTPASPPDMLDEIATRLSRAGARTGGAVPKLFRAVGAPPHNPLTEGDHVAGATGGTIAEVVGAALRRSTERIFLHDPGVRAGDDPEEVHQARVATRRIRSDLVTFEALLHPDWARTVRRSLRKLARLLGNVRDADVLLERFALHAQGLQPEESEAASTLLESLRRRREADRRDLVAYMDSKAYLAVLDRLVEGVTTPPVPTPTADSRLALGAAVSSRWDALNALVVDIDAKDTDPSDPELHAIRIAAKGCRYAAEASALVVGAPARRLARALADLQGVLGELQDAAVAEEWLRDAAREASADQAFVAGLLVAVERDSASVARLQWRAAWKAARRPELRAWMREGHPEDRKGRPGR